LREELGGYLLGALDPGERDAVAAHLATCPACAAEHERLALLPDLLTRADGLEIPAAPPAVEERLLDRVARERGLRRRVRRRGLPRLTRGRAVVAAALAGAAVGAGAMALAPTLGSDEGAATGAQYALVLSGAQGASARAELEPGRGGTEVHLWVKGLPPGAEAVYEVRCERSGWSASAGTFRADARGRAYVVLSTAARIGEYERIRVVRRPNDAEILAGEVQ
jgi:anti-sigma factor RsiW